MADQIFERMDKDDVRFVNLQFSDLFGNVKSLTIPAKNFDTALEHGAWFDGSSVAGFAKIHESDMYLKPDLSTYSVIPWLKSEYGNTARFICDIFDPDGTPFSGDPRHILKKAIAEARALGFDYFTGPEMEFFLFRKENGALKPLPHDKGGYFDFTSDQAYHVRREMNHALQAFGINVEASHHEVALGQHEIDFRYDHALKAADSASTLRVVLKAIAQKHDLHATFMAKPIAGINGSGMHVNQSLFKDGKNAFYDDADRYGLSKTAQSFIAGQLLHAPAMAGIFSPTVNSYKRLVPGYEAPVYISWARRNRSVLVRIPRISHGRPSSTRIELRCPDPTCNIYLTFAVILKAGLDGIKRNLSPPDAVEENLFHMGEERMRELGIKTLPGSLGDAIREMQTDPIVRETLGDQPFARYVDSKKKEWDSFRLAVTEWELERYLEKY
ncbi:MAG: glutamine synthetase family protein [Candidatus Micrarchaeota archaeon]